MNFRYRLMQFMIGRYGPDKLGYAIICLAFVLSIVNMVLRIFTNSIVSLIIQLIVYALMGLAIFRILSRNIFARQRENEKFCNAINILNKKKAFYNQKKADKYHVYRKCPTCKAVLRLPHRLGKHKTICPRCSKEFTVKVRK